MTGTQKQIDWAKEIRAAKIAAIASNESGMMGNDCHCREITGFWAKSVSREISKEERRAIKRERRAIADSITFDELRAMVISELDKTDNAAWWIENRDADVFAMTATEILDNKAAE